MIDFQTIFIRDVADLQQINFIAVLRVEAQETAGVQAVYINGVESKFIKAVDGSTIYAHLPAGIPQAGVTSVKLLRVRTTESGSEKTVETLFSNENGLDPTTQLIDEHANNSPLPVGFFGGVLQLRGEDFSSAQRVKINNEDVPFSIVSKTEIMCALPEKAPTIDRIDVITTSKTINRQTYFEYMIDPNPATVIGMQKLIQQFIKLLLTTKGSDIFEPTIGGDLQQFVGTNFAPGNVSSLVAQVTVRVMTVGVNMSLRQTIAGVPPNERLSDVQVLGVSVDPDDPTIMSLSLKLNTFGGRSAQFDTMIGEAVNYAESVRDTFTATTGGAGPSGY